MTGRVCCVNAAPAVSKLPLARPAPAASSRNNLFSCAVPCRAVSCRAVPYEEKEEDEEEDEEEEEDGEEEEEEEEEEE